MLKLASKVLHDWIFEIYTFSNEQCTTTFNHSVTLEKSTDPTQQIVLIAQFILPTDDRHAITQTHTHTQLSRYDYHRSRSLRPMRVWACTIHATLAMLVSGLSAHVSG